LPDDAIVVTANATACITFFQAAELRRQHRVIWNSGSASMGYGLPAAIGAAAATGRKVVCLEGEGSLMMNLQELETLRQTGLDVHVFVLENGGYVSIRQTQTNFFAGRYIGTGPASGVTFPESEALAGAFRLPFARLTGHAELDGLGGLLERNGPTLTAVRLPDDYAFSPKTSSLKRPDGTMVSKPLEDMAPFLPRDEFRSVMLVPPLDEE
jgi:acetolactate synthase-1/2/3 large subunit